MRGKEHNPVTYIHLLGITPAYAGKSLLNVDGAFCLEDHPRVCGEKLCIDLFVQDRLGSPPRMRGKDARSKSAHNSAGITPAYAGKSCIFLRLLGFPRDHPRVCGEKVTYDLAGSFVLGSPPRMRGKVVTHLHKHRFAGITPAYAGKRHQRPAYAYV